MGMAHHGYPTRTCFQQSPPNSRRFGGVLWSLSAGPQSSEDWECWEDPRSRGWICSSPHFQRCLGGKVRKLNWELGMGWEWDRPVPRGGVTFGNGIIPVPRGGVTFGLGGCLPKSWMEFREPLSRMGWAGVGSGRGYVHTEGHTGATPARGHGWRGQGTSLGQLPQLWEGALPLDPDLNPGIPLPLVSWNNLGGKGPFKVTKSNPTSSIFTPCLTYQRRRPR